MMHKTIKELLGDKRRGVEWHADEVAHFVHALVKGTASHAQAAAFLMAACIHGLTNNETAALTREMANSGYRIAPNTTARTAIDKHSTGGVGDKVSLLVAPLAVCCGLAVPMISGRGLGHTGGTVDKLESVPGMRTGLSPTEMETLLEQHHCFMASQHERIAPADNILYALRDVTGTVENRGLITASILSKKLAEGLDGLVMDMKYGSGAFMATIEEAQQLANDIQTVAAAAGLPVECVFTETNIPLGTTVGNLLEVHEAYLALFMPSQCSIKLRQCTLDVVVKMLQLSNPEQSEEASREAVLHHWNSGAAAAEFLAIFARQGGHYQPPHNNTIDTQAALPVLATQPGIWNPPDARITAIACMKAGAGRLQSTDTIDPNAGVYFPLAPGTPISTGDAVVWCYATDPRKKETLRNTLQQLM
jgi:pyrimidine-nucleoside phosphorylase